MILRNGMRLHRRAKDSWGERGYAFWMDDCFDPPIVFVRGDNLSDAEDWFICDPWVEARIKVDDVDFKAEFCTNGEPDEAKLMKAMDDGVIRQNDNGVLVWSEGICCRQLFGPQEY